MAESVGVLDNRETLFTIPLDIFLGHDEYHYQVLWLRRFRNQVLIGATTNDTAEIRTAKVPAG